MNIQPGDKLAYIVGAGTPGLNGRIVRVIERATPGEPFPIPGGPVVPLGSGRTDDWWIEASTPMPYRTTTDGNTYMVTERPIRDRFLRPIRDLPGEDQILARVGKPQLVGA